MICAQALISLSLLSPCGGGGSGLEAIETAVANASRPAADQQRDEARKPVDVLDFLGIKPGMTVLDVFAGGGYYTEILDGVVGEDGRVFSHNNQAYLNFVGPQVEERFKDGRLGNSQKLIVEANDIALEDNSLDAVVMILAYHDFFFANDQYSWPKVDESAFLESMCKAMKPGAILGVADHVANPGGDVTDVAFTLHRLDPQRVMSDMTESCFKLADESDILRNVQDDHTKSAVIPEMSGKTDRFLFRFIRK
jgi:predicted methyltransferase